jgi:hypothetical protein
VTSVETEQEVRRGRRRGNFFGSVELEAQARRRCTEGPALAPPWSTSSKEVAMLTLSITLFMLALIVAGFGIVGTVGSGAFAFSAGFLILAAISILSFWRGHPA